MSDINDNIPRRGFLSKVAAGTAAVGLASLTPALNLHAEQSTTTSAGKDNPDAWFKKIRGKHRIVFDAPMPKEILTFAWPRVFLMTNAATGTPEKDCGVVVVLRHEAIPFAFESKLWEKYKFGEMFKVNDPKTKAPAIRNPFEKPEKGDFVIPGVGEIQIGINELQTSGVLFCVCSAAMTVYSAAAAGEMKTDGKEVFNEWKAGLLSGVQVVPSGVWAVNRAQEHGCTYCFAG